MNTFWRLLAAAMVCCHMASGTVQAGEREETMRALIDGVRGADRATTAAQLSDLHRLYEGTKTLADRQLLGLALGVRYLDSSPRLALQYLSSAEQASSSTDSLLPMIRYYLAFALFQGGAYQTSAQMAKSLLAGAQGDVWVKRTHSLLIENLHAMGDYAKLTEEFKSFSRRFSFSRRQEILARMAVEAFIKQGDQRSARELLEELARNYPATQESRWAFHQLEVAACLPESEGRYLYSERLLLALSGNALLNAGVEEFVVAAVDQPVTTANGTSHLMTLGEKVDFFVHARLYKRALTVVEGQYQDVLKRPDPGLKAALMYELGRLRLRLFEPQAAAHNFADFLAEFPRHPLVHRVQESLGDALRYSGEPLAASEYYGAALAARPTPVLRWMYFWTLLRGKDFRKALALLDKPGFITPREGDDPLVVRYWQARLLDQVGRSGEAMAIYRDILQHHAQSFYAMAIVTRYPALAQPAGEGTKEPASSPPGTANGFLTVALAAKVGPPSPTAEATTAWLPKASLAPEEASDPGPQRGDLKLVQDLMRVGLMDAASAQLASMKWAGFNGLAAFRGIAKMSSQLDDYRPSRNIRYTGFTSLRSLPSSWQDMMQAQALNGEEWRAYYPLAFERLVLPFSAGLRLSPFLALSIMRTESFYNKEARSGVGAQGLMQLMPYTAMKIATLLHDESFDVREVGNPAVNIGYGIYYIDRLLRLYSDNPVLAAAAYNGGPVVVNQWLGTCGGCEADEFVDSIPYLETRKYVREVLRSMDLYSRIYTGKPGLSSLPLMPLTVPSEREIF